MALSRILVCVGDNSVSKYWYHDYSSVQAYGLEEGLHGKGNKLLQEQPVWIDEGGMYIDAARASSGS